MEGAMRRWMLVVAVFSWSIALAGSAAAQTTHPNILLIIGDDIGRDEIQAYRGGTDHPHTPNIDQLAAEGVKFTNAWSNPVCAVTRATIQTGRYGYRTGILGQLGELQASELTIPELLPAAGA